MLNKQRRPPKHEELSHVEALLGQSLPPRFRQFIQHFNGGFPKKHIYNRVDGSGVFFQLLFPIGTIPRSLAEEMLSPRLPSKLISIGLLGDGGSLCLHLDSDRIFLWEYDNLDENGKITDSCVEAVEPDIYTFFEKLAPGEVDKIPDEPDPVADMACFADSRLLEEYVKSGGDLILARTQFGRTIVQEAIQYEDFPFIEECLRLGAPISCALHSASKSNRPDAIKWLIGKGADVNELDATGHTPLDLATPGTGAQLILTEHGARHGSEFGPGT